MHARVTLVIYHIIGLKKSNDRLMVPHEAYILKFAVNVNKDFFDFIGLHYFNCSKSKNH